jgi:hypothetical protein
MPSKQCWKIDLIDGFDRNAVRSSSVRIHYIDMHPRNHEIPWSTNTSIGFAGK